MGIKQIPITILTGYLGAGKTTVVNHILHNQSGMRVAVITNDMGEINIDASLIERGNAVSRSDESLVALSNGCICCTLRADLIQQVALLVKANRFDYILVEASGICEPLPIAQTLTLLDGSIENGRLPKICRLDTIATIIDAYRLVSEFMGGETLLHADELDDEDISRLLVEQIEFCNVIILNKTDLINTEQLQDLKKILHTLQPAAKIVETSFGKVAPEAIMNAHRFNFQEACVSPGWIQALAKAKDGEKEGEEEEYGINSFVYQRRQPFNQKKLNRWIESWPENVVRCKGVVWFSEQSDMSFLFEQAGKSISITPFGRWLAEATKLEQEEAMAKNPSIQKEWDPECGDRMTVLVFIGLHLNKEEISASLDACLSPLMLFI